MRLLGEPEHRVTRSLAEVVDLDQHVVGDQALHEVAPERWSGPRCCTAGPPGYCGIPCAAIERAAGKNRVSDTSTLVGSVSTLTPWPAPGQPRGREVRAGLDAVEDVDEDPLRAALERGAAERVVDPVGDEHAADAEPLVGADAAVDPGLACTASGRRLTLHPNRSEDSIPMITASFPAAITRRACAGLYDEPEPASPRAAGLRVDVVLHRPQRPDLSVDRLRLIARLIAVRGSSRQIGASAAVWATTSRSPAMYARCSHT